MKKSFLNKIFFNQVFNKIKLISNKTQDSTKKIKDLFSFIFLKSLLSIHNPTIKTIEVNNKTVTKTPLQYIINKIYKFIYKCILLFLINFFTLYLKLEKKIFFFLVSIIIPSSIFLLIRHYAHLCIPEILHEYLAPNTAQLLQNIYPFSLIDNYGIFENLLITYIFPLSGFFMLYIVCWLNLDLFDYNPTEESFCEMSLLTLLQIYSKNFLEDTQEELINTYIPLEDEYQAEWDNKVYIWFYLFILISQQVWTVDFHSYWPILPKRENAVLEDTLILRKLAKYTDKNLDPNMDLYGKMLPVVSYEEEDYGENIIFHLTDVYNEYIKIVLFKLHPYLQSLETFFYIFFFIIFLLFLFLNLLMTSYFKQITAIYFEQLTYTIYRPFLDQYFYSWYRLFFNIAQTKNQTFLIRNSYRSQYLDLFKFLPDTEQMQTSFFEKVFNSNFNYYPTIETLDDISFDEENLIEPINPIVPNKYQQVNLFFLILGSFFVMDVLRKNPLFFSNRYHENLPFFIPLSHINHYSWLFQTIQTSPTSFYLDWIGWIFLTPKLKLVQTYLDFSNHKLLKKKNWRLKNRLYKLNYWEQFDSKLPYQIAQISIKDHFRIYLEKKKFRTKQSIIWFGKGLIEFFLTTTILPRFRFKRNRKKIKPFYVKKILIAFKQKRKFFLRKNSFLNTFKKNK